MALDSLAAEWLVLAWPRARSVDIPSRAISLSQGEQLPAGALPVRPSLRGDHSLSLPLVDSLPPVASAAESVVGLRAQGQEERRAAARRAEVWQRGVLVDAVVRRAQRAAEHSADQPAARVYQRRCRPAVSSSAVGPQPSGQQAVAPSVAGPPFQSERALVAEALARGEVPQPDAVSPSLAVVVSRVRVSAASHYRVVA